MIRCVINKYNINFERLVIYSLSNDNNYFIENLLINIMDFNKYFLKQRSLLKIYSMCYMENKIKSLLSVSSIIIFILKYKFDILTGQFIDKYLNEINICNINSNNIKVNPSIFKVINLINIKRYFNYIEKFISVMEPKYCLRPWLASKWIKNMFIIIDSCNNNKRIAEILDLFYDYLENIQNLLTKNYLLIISNVMQSY